MNNDFEKLLEEYLSEKENNHFRQGQIVKGTVVGEDDHNYYVDIGYKIEAILPKEEVQQEGKKLKVGDKIEAVLVRITNRLQHPRISLRSLRKRKLLEEIKNAVGTYKTFEAVVEGYLVNINGVKALLPVQEVEGQINENTQVQVVVIDVKKEGKYFQIFVSQKKLKEFSAENIDILLSRLIKKLETIDKEKNFKYLVDYLKEITRLYKDLKEGPQLDKKLIISVIGVVKAGKSTFVNSLLFNGEDVLPKALTPTTATLTVLDYSPDQNEAVITYYTPQEWESFKFQISDENELRRLNEVEQKIKHLFGKKETIKASDYKELIRKVKEHIAGDMSYAVSYVEIKTNLPQLKDIKLVDTPGLNDPVQARSLKTLEFLKDSHVVYFLSRASQFLEGGDFKTLESLLSRGIKNINLFASRYDEQLKTVAVDLFRQKEKKNSLKTSKGLGLLSKLNNLNQTQQQQQPQKVKLDKAVKLLKEKLERDRLKIVFERFGDKKPELNFELLSSLFHKAGLGKLTPEEEQHLRDLTNYIELPPGFKFPEDFAKYSGMDFAELVLEVAKEDRQKIICEKARDYYKGILKGIEEKTEQVITSISNILESSQDLIKTLEMLEKVIDKLNNNINQTVKTHIRGTRRLFSTIINHALNHLREDVETLELKKGERIETVDYTEIVEWVEEKCGGREWHKERRKRTCTIRYIHVDIMETVDSFVDRIEATVEKYKRTLKERQLNPNQVKDVLKEKILSQVEKQLDLILLTLNKKLKEEGKKPINPTELKAKVKNALENSLNQMKISPLSVNPHFNREELIELLRKHTFEVDKIKYYLSELYSDDRYLTCDEKKKLATILENIPGVGYYAIERLKNCDMSDSEVKRFLENLIENSDFISYELERIFRDSVIPLIYDLERQIREYEQEYYQFLKQLDENLNNIVKNSLRDLIKQMKEFQKEKDKYISVFKEIEIAVKRLREEANRLAQTVGEAQAEGC